MYGAGNEIRTRDLNLGKVALYQLSYSRVKGCALWGMALFVSTAGAWLRAPKIQFIGANLCGTPRRGRWS